MRLLIAIPLLIILVLFTLSNRAPVHIGFWPTDFRAEVPLSIAVLIAAGVAFFCGGALTWLSALAQARRARRAEARVRALDAQVTDLKARVASLSAAPAASLPPPA